MTDYVKGSAPRAKRFQIYVCGDPDCGPHIITFDRRNKPLSEMVLGRAQLPGFIEQLQEFFAYKEGRHHDH